MFLEVIGSERLSGKKRERTPGFSETQKDFNYTRSRKKRGGKKRKKKVEKKKEKNEQKEASFRKTRTYLRNSLTRAAAERAVLLISAETFHDRVRTLLQIVRANISESSLIPFVMRMKGNKERRRGGKRIRNKKGRNDTKKKKRRKTAESFCKACKIASSERKRERGGGRRKASHENELNERR